jgi:predicted amidohydrolase YtcJ
VELHRSSIDLHLHTVGDAASRTALDAVEQARSAVGGTLNTRVTLCHLELLSAADIPRFKGLGVVANTTPHWNGGYFQGADRWLGLERYNRMYRVQPLLDAGATVTFSSDITDHIEWETDRANPFLGMEIGHTRQEGPNGPVRPPEAERLKLEDLVRGYTLNGAFQLRKDGELGSIEVGKSADLVVLNKNLFEVGPYDIHTVAPVAVLIEGQLAFGKLP